MDPTPDVPILPYGAISPEFENLLQATINKVDREWPQKWRDYPGAAFIVESCARVCWNTHLTVKYVCATEPPRPERRPEFALSIVPVIRSLADTVFLLVYLFEAIPERTALYLKGGWREWAEELSRAKKAYGDDPDWKEWLEGFKRGLEANRVTSGISEDEAKNPASLPFWPIPSRMLKDKALSDRALVFLNHVNDWHYRSFSSYTHLSLPGLVMRSSGLKPTSNEEEERIRVWRVDKQRSDAIGAGLLLNLAAMSEVDAACSFGLHTRLRYIWTVLNGYYGMAKDFYSLRYDQLLTRDVS
jgi:hypothetical protein